MRRTPKQSWRSPWIDLGCLRGRRRIDLSIVEVLFCVQIVGYWHLIFIGRLDLGNKHILVFHCGKGACGDGERRGSLRTWREGRGQSFSMGAKNTRKKIFYI